MRQPYHQQHMARPVRFPTVRHIVNVPGDRRRVVLWQWQRMQHLSVASWNAACCLPRASTDSMQTTIYRNADTLQTHDAVPTEIALHVGQEP